MWDRYWSLESSGTEEGTGLRHNDLQIISDRVLKNFKNTIQKREEQLEKGIIKKVSPDDPIEGSIVHSLPHQAVITPLKETTKMRIVFDASTHYKDSQCLNDVLYQGPPLLPDMILLRISNNICWTKQDK
ncbi:hypothetical protein NECAME_14702 [Necator americanus]|uniref:Uncharacterized protein n=1 Tax=Necator americanus TaxID=51031 RepID=W2SLJ4_NECAM|nr:hypothetical protein NECAME_14702 [Necator americanus]ETN70539.1 hypothetical protein NECAME_14702 [Necator americanus]